MGLEGQMILAATELLSLNPTASLTDIAAALGVSRSALLRCFKTREGLIRKIALKAFRNGIESGRPFGGNESVPALERFDRTVDETLHFCAEFHFLALFADTFDDPELNPLRDEYRRGWMRLIQSLQAEGEIDAALPERWVHEHLQDLLGMAWKLISSGELSVSAAPGLVKRTFFCGVGNLPEC